MSEQYGRITLKRVYQNNFASFIRFVTVYFHLKQNKSIIYTGGDKRFLCCDTFMGEWISASIFWTVRHSDNKYLIRTTRKSQMELTVVPLPAFFSSSLLFSSYTLTFTICDIISRFDLSPRILTVANLHFYRAYAILAFRSFIKSWSLGERMTIDR